MNPFNPFKRANMNFEYTIQLVETNFQSGGVCRLRYRANRSISHRIDEMFTVGKVLHLHPNDFVIRNVSYYYDEADIVVEVEALDVVSLLKRPVAPPPPPEPEPLQPRRFGETPRRLIL